MKTNGSARSLGLSVAMGTALAIAFAFADRAQGQAQPPQHPLAAHRARVHHAARTHRQNVHGALQTHHQNVSANVQARRQNLAGNVQTHRQNSAAARQSFVNNVSDNRAAVAAARATLPPCQPATLLPSGNVVYPTEPLYVPPITINAPPPAPSVPTVTVNAPPAPTPVAPTAAPSIASPSTPSPAPSVNPVGPATSSPGAGADEADNDELGSDEPADPFEGSTSYPVLRVEDGGITVVLKVGDGETKVRMIGVTSVSLAQKANLPERLTGKRLPSTESYMENLLKGENVYVVYDRKVAEEDAERKCVGYVYRAPDGLMVNLEVIRAGFAVADMTYDFDQRETFAKYQDAAKKAGKGIYGIVERIKASKGEK